MSFSSEVKENLNENCNYNKENLEAEFIGYRICGNMLENENDLEFITENEFNIEHFYKILFNLKIEYEPEIKGKCFVARICKEDAEKIMKKAESLGGEICKNIVKGAFLGSGSVNNPEKNYHLEVMFSKEKYADYLKNICERFGISLKKINVNGKYQLYLKESEEISKFLALIGASRAVLKFEDVRIMKEMKNKINRKVNCETANLNKTVEAAINQIDDIQFLKKINKFDSLPAKLKEIADLRIKNPDLSLKDLGELVYPPVRKIWCK